MKVINFAVVAAAMLVVPVLLCSCNSNSAKKENKPEVQTPKTAASDEPKPVEITSESSFAAEAPAKEEPAKAVAEAPAKEEPAKAVAEAPAKEEPAKAVAEAPAKEEPAKAAAEAPAKEEPAKAAAEAPAKEEPAKAAAEAPAKEETAKAVAEAPAKKEPAKAAAKAEPVKSAKAKLPCEHTVRTGDNLWKISRRYYGSGNYWKKIYEANKSEIRKPEFLEPGTVLKIPAN